MSDGSADDVVVVALEVADPGLRDRIAALLAGLPGLRLASTGEPADVRLVMPTEGGAPGQSDALTPREHEVLELMAEGASNRRIAEKLGISVHTAKFHVGQVIDKLDATGRTDAVAHAARTGVIHL